SPDRRLRPTAFRQSASVITAFREMRVMPRPALARFQQSRLGDCCACHSGQSKRSSTPSQRRRRPLVSEQTSPETRQPVRGQAEANMTRRRKKSPQAKQEPAPDDAAPPKPAHVELERNQIARLARAFAGR